MARKRKGRNINGILLVDKPTGVSSNHVVQHIKRLYKAAKAGHTGALDPLATGLLPVCLGEATKFSQALLDSNKAYLVTAKLGQRTDTSDADGEIVETKEVNVTQEEIKEAITSFIGDIAQVPSMYSALKHEGKPLYWYARQGIHIDRPSRNITIFDIKWISLEEHDLTLHVTCSKGTYIRTLVDDLGEKLGCGAHVTMLRRTQVAHFDSSQMLTYEELDITKQAIINEARCHTSLQADASENSKVEITNFSALDTLLLPTDSTIINLPKLTINDAECELFQKGVQLAMNASLREGDLIRVYRESDTLFLGIAHINENQQIQPKRVVVY